MIRYVDPDCELCKFENTSIEEAPCKNCIDGSNWRNSLTIAHLIGEAHVNAVNKGFWDNPRELGTMIAIIHSELSEALEADRKGDKENSAEELADVAIRLADLCGGLEIDLESAILAKMEKNRKRSRLHGKRY